VKVWFINASLYLAGKEEYGNRNLLSDDSKNIGSVERANVEIEW
jgi:hypothetical protein